MDPEPGVAANVCARHGVFDSYLVLRAYPLQSLVLKDDINVTGIQKSYLLSMGRA